MVKKDNLNLNLKDTKTQFYLAIGLLVVLSLFVNYTYTNDFQSLPSPLYGGDYYYQLGAVNHVKDGGNPFSSSSMLEELPAYFPVYAILVGYFAKIFFLDGITAMFITSYLFCLLSVIICFLFANKLFKNVGLSFVFALFVLLEMSKPIIKYTPFGMFVIVPLFLYLLYKFVEIPCIKNSILLGLAYGITSLTHGVLLMMTSAILLSTFIYFSLYNNFYKNWKEKKSFKLNYQLIKKEILPYLIIFLIGAPIAMLWWFFPLFYFHGSTLKTGFEELPLNIQFSTLWDIIKSLFLTSKVYLLSALFNIIGVFTLLFAKIKKDEIKYAFRFVRFLLLTSLIIIFHYFITQNLFGFNFSPGYLFGMLTIPFLLISIIGIYFVSLVIFKENKSYTHILYLAIVIIILLSITQNFKTAESDKWVSVGKNPISPYLSDLKKFMEKNTNVEDTILTTKEVGFSVNALTGRKLVAVRRGHTGPFLFTLPYTRESDLAIMLYGNNTEYKKELIKKYGAKYLYWDYYWIQSEYYFDEQGRIVNWFDPLLIEYTPEMEKKLNDNGVKYFIEMSWVDPVIRGERQKIIFISPENYHNASHPWNPNLDKLMEEVWSYDANGQTIAKLYKISS